MKTFPGVISPLGVFKMLYGATSALMVVRGGITIPESHGQSLAVLKQTEGQVKMVHANWFQF